MGKVISSEVDNWLTEDALFLIECWARDYALKDVAGRMGISETTLWLWRKEYPEIEKAVKQGKEVVDYKVECALLKLALGSKKKSVKTVVNGEPDAKGNRSIRVETVEEDVLPNATAALAWLNNRSHDKWKRNRDNTIELTDDQSNITINIVKKDDSKAVVDEQDDSWNVDSADSLVLKESRSKEEPESWDDGSWPDEDDDW